MADCVSRDDVRRFIADAFSENRFATNYDYAILFDEIDELPAADVQPVRRGRWIITDDVEHFIAVCSECGRTIEVLYWQPLPEPPQD